MPAPNWPTKQRSVASLHLDAKNPRLGRETLARAPRDIVQYLFEHDKALEIAESIATRGYFPNEPLLAVVEDDRTVVIEGNRRLAALKALREPGLLEGPLERRLERLSRRLDDPNAIATVPVTIAPSRRATDRQVAGRHVGTGVRPWQAENRASFILEKLEEGYTNDQLRSELGFSTGNIQEARQTRAIADMARSLDLSDEVRDKIDQPRAQLFTTLERVFDSTVGRQYLMVAPDPDHGLVGKTSKAEFIRGFTRLVTDVALKRVSSRSLNKAGDIEKYFKKWKPEELPTKRHSTFIPADIVAGRTIASTRPKSPSPRPTRSKQINTCVLPKSLKLLFGNDRMIDIRRELTKLKRDDFPNAGAVLLRVFFELTALHYLERTDRLRAIIERLEKRGARLQHGTPTMRELVPELNKVAEKHLKPSEAAEVEKALRYDRSAPFTINSLHGFVHQADLPSARDILQFWTRTEPLFRLMLEHDEDGKEST